MIFKQNELVSDDKVHYFFYHSSNNSVHVASSTPHKSQISEGALL